MKHFFLSLFIIHCSLSIAFAQNLVPNPSFEDYTQCPDNEGQINYATGWSSYSESPDYYNSCATNPDFSVPNNLWDYKPAATGNAYAAVITYYPDPNGREFMGVELASPLVIGKEYYISFKVNFCLKIPYFVNTATNGIGVIFSTIPYNQATPAPVNNFAHVYTNTIITETEWKTITGSFIADEAYSYLYIGNPFDDANTDTVSYDSSNPPGSYYLIDDVYVSETPLSTHENSLQANVTVYPTIVEHQFFIALNELHNKECSISIYNALGMEIQTIKNPNESIITVNATNYAKGMYFVKIEANKKVITKKIIVK